MAMDSIAMLRWSIYNPQRFAKIGFGWHEGGPRTCRDRSRFTGLWKLRAFR